MPDKKSSNIEDNIYSCGWLSMLEYGHDLIQSVLDIIDALVVVLDKSGKITCFNKKCEKLTGYSFEEIKNKHVWDLFLIPEEIDSVKQVFDDLKIGNFPNNHVNYWLTKKGERCLISWSNTALVNKKGEAEYIIATGINITEEKISEDKYQNLIENTPLCVKVFDKDGGLIFVNKGGREEHFLMDKNEEEIKKWDWLETVKDEYRDYAKSKFKEALEGKSSFMELEHTKEGATHSWCRGYISPIKDDKNKIKSILFYSFDITDLKKYQNKIENIQKAVLNILEDTKESEADLKKERNRINAVIGSIGEGLLVVNKNYGIVLMNKKAENILNTSLDNVLGKNINDIAILCYGEEEIPKEKRIITKVFEKKESIKTNIDDNFNYRIKSGQKIPVQIIATPLLDGEDVIGGVIVFRDITEEKLLNESKNSFISVASHQLRTPLTSIRWYAEMLETEDAGPLNKNQKDFIGRIYSGTLRLNETINTLLFLARAESGRLKIELKKIGLFSFIQDVLKELDPLIKEKNIIVSFDPNFDKTVEVEFDQSVLRQIVTNLLSNSIRYTENSGHIEIDVRKMPGSVVCSVKDDGIGVPLSQREMIFKKFFRAENAVSKVPDGTGLGLSLIKSLVEANGGAVWFESPVVWVGAGGEKIEKGTAFRFTIPIK